MTSEPADPGGLGRIDAAVEELRHATYGLFGPALRARLFEQLGWEWSPVHYRVLRIVEGTDPMRPTVGELAAAVAVDKARATRLVGQLREAGLLTSAAGRLDRRRREVELTRAGRDVLTEARRLRLEFFAAALQDWDAADVEAFASLIERFNASVRETGW